MENEELEDFSVNFVEQPFKKRRLDTQSITDYCDANGLASQERGARDKARLALRDQAKRNWAEEGRAGSLTQMRGADSVDNIDIIKALDELPGWSTPSPKVLWKLDHELTLNIIGARQYFWSQFQSRPTIV